MVETWSSYPIPKNALNVTYGRYNREPIQSSEYDMISPKFDAMAQTVGGKELHEMPYIDLRPEITNLENVTGYLMGTTMINRKDLIKSALDEPRYNWRTIEGIAHETLVPRAEIMKTIMELSQEGILVRSSKVDKMGRPLFTTRDNYSKNNNLIERILSAISDRAR